MSADGAGPAPERPWSLLDVHLEPIQDLLHDDAVSEIAVNRPGEVWIETAGEALMRARPQPEYHAEKLRLLANAVAAHSHQQVSAAHPLLSARLPNGERIQIMAEPVVGEGVAFALRRSVTRRFTLDDYQERRAFERVRVARDRAASDEDEKLARLLRDGKIREFLALAVLARKNIIISGGTSSGKTTFANALIGEIPMGERLVSIEDARELAPDHENFLPLIVSRGEQNEAQVDAVKLLQASLRLRPDRILLGELRGEEAYPWLRAINTGHPGAITTVHADTPGGAVDQIAFMALQAKLALSFEDVRAYVKSIIDIIVQLSRVDGERRVESIWFRHVDAD